MKNYVIVLLIICVIFSWSVIYRQRQTTICYRFPVPENLKEEAVDVPFYIFFSFSKKNCLPCLIEIIEVLNALPPQFRAAGIVPGKELENESDIRRLTGASFPLYSDIEYRKYLPGQLPMLFGVSPAGKITFVLPAIEGQKVCIEKLLVQIYSYRYLSFEKEYRPGSKEK
ncbi:MAG: hypothetical protein KAW12_28165 [Candidatus Aminicenantes bacterium]|nr:hypothetical protein [Candidatus Aminicenantes bacterium]